MNSVLDRPNPHRLMSPALPIKAIHHARSWQSQTSIRSRVRYDAPRQLETLNG